MRRIASVLTLMAAAVLLTGSTLMASERMGSNAMDSGKDLCLLASINCANQVDSIQMRITRLNREIAKGTDVYTREELNVLKNELNEANSNLESLISGA